MYMYTSAIYFSCDQATLWMVQSVRLSVRPSSRHCSFSLCSYHHTIIKFSGVITIDRSHVHAKGQCHRSKIKVTDVKTQFNRFRTVTPVWIHIWRWNDVHSLIWHKRGVLLFFKLIRQISGSHGTKIPDFDLNGAFPGCNSSLNSPMALKWCAKFNAVKKRRPIDFQCYSSNFKVTRAEKSKILIQFEWH